MKVLVTGGSGLVGSTLTDLLLARGDEVVAIDNFATGRRDNLKEHARLTFVEGSITDSKLVREIVETTKPGAVVHTAASYKNPDDWENDALVNATGTAIVARAAKDFGVKRIVYFQTALCYGIKPIQQPIRLDHPMNPANSSYSISKTAGEHYVEHSGIDWVTFRLANVVGPRAVSGPLPIFFQRLSEGKRCFVTPARRDYVFAADLANIVSRAVNGEGAGTYHFSSGKDVPIRQIYDLTTKAMKLNDAPEPELKELAPDDAPSILLDPSRTFADFGEIKFTPIEEIVERTIDYYRDFGVQGGFTHLKGLGAKS
ncbi:NAD-dependent epimerase/dehydratase family protein [Bosea sp. (in: a-proteobacteria)]|uniref:NAD-dependent epimerase/dehydratase family protein n=1 Tax=Bosea sp. (in: a-proteobacteria) TaxID=1871050 RepID=UPI00122B76E2|nr:NAD-dependent epimerase/dehydratase family protein [Bosea sp. (in: a-proteobacteria)]TAJ27528.1 MAG: NAD-dependent epimerase/dehydratase family protein [Bosea sp. (in: a-proteobacteria)]